jgi:hypothetical protein
MGKSPAEQKNNSFPVKEITLPSGKIASVIEAKGKHIREAQRQSGEESDKIIFALIAVCTTIDGKKLVVEDIDDMNSKDVFALMGEFGSAF